MSQIRIITLAAFDFVFSPLVCHRPDHIWCYENQLVGASVFNRHFSSLNMEFTFKHRMEEI